MSKPVSFQSVLKPLVIVFFLIWLVSCGDKPDAIKAAQLRTLFPKLGAGSYFGEIVLANKRAGYSPQRRPFLVVVKDEGRLSWSVGDYQVKEGEGSYSGVANLLLPFTIDLQDGDLQDGRIELTWQKSACSSESDCLTKAKSVSHWQGEVLWRGGSKKTRTITFAKENGGKVGVWYLRVLDDESALSKSDISVGEDLTIAPKGKVELVGVKESPVPTIEPSAQHFDLSGSLEESGFCELSAENLNELIAELQSERKKLAQQLHYSVRATPVGRLVWLSRLLLMQESLKIRPIADAPVVPVINNEIEAEKRRLAALQALGIQ